MANDSLKQWEVRSSTGKHFDVLDGIRGVAILMVVAYHTFYTNPSGGLLTHTIGGLIGTGWLGVPIFFVLSGFLISFPFFRERASDTQSWYQKGYARRRIGKIIPPFYLSIILFTLYYFLRYSNPTYLHAAWEFALGLTNFIRPPAEFYAPYWSLIVEAHFYFLLPFLFLFTRGLKPRAAAIVIFSVLLVLPLAIRELTWPETISKGSVQFSISRFPCALDYFAWGVLFGGIFVSLSTKWDKFRGLSRLGYAGFGLLILVILFWAVPARNWDLIDHPARWSTELFHIYLPSIATFLMLFFVFDPEGIGSRVFGHPWLRFTGIISYEWFLFHQPVVVLFSEIFGNTHGNILLYLCKTALPLALTYGFSVLVYRYFSYPLLNRIRGSRPYHAKATSADSPTAPVLQQ
jgi:peptidoglycan/LPS O-acetylase OafA/YrhL